MYLFTLMNLPFTVFIVCAVESAIPCITREKSLKLKR